MSARRRVRMWEAGTFGMIGGTTSVLIVDDHDGFRSWARRLLEAEGFELVGEAENGTTALAAVDQLNPEVVLLDVQLPDRDGFQVVDQLTASGNRPRVVLVSTRDRSDYADRLETNEVLGFITKSKLTPDLIRRGQAWAHLVERSSRSTPVSGSCSGNGGRQSRQSREIGSLGRR